MENRDFWSSQPRRRPAESPTPTMRVVHQANARFELSLGHVRLDLTGRDLLKLKSLIDRSVEVYATHLREKQGPDTPSQDLPTG